MVTGLEDLDPLSHVQRRIDEGDFDPEEDPEALLSLRAACLNAGLSSDETLDLMGRWTEKYYGLRGHGAHFMQSDP